MNNDRAQHTKDVDEAVETNLQKGDLNKVWRRLKGWYGAVEEKALKPCRLSMKKANSGAGGIV